MVYSRESLIWFGGLQDGKAKRQTLFVIKFYVHTLLLVAIVVVVVAAAQEKPDFSAAETLERFLPCILVERVPYVQKGPHLQ